MGTAVDVIWGKCVRYRMLPTLRLEPFDLWGDFEHVKLWLEWDEYPLSSQSRLERFAVFVMHPEAMIFASQPIKGKIEGLSIFTGFRTGEAPMERSGLGTSLTTYKHLLGSPEL